MFIQTQIWFHSMFYLILTFSRDMNGVKKEALPLLLGQFSKFTSVYQHLVRPYLSSFLCPQ